MTKSFVLACTVCPDGFGRWMISFNDGTRRRPTYATARNAVLAALKLRKVKGPFEITVDEMKGTKMVRNLMSGKMVEIARTTPLCCDPSSETYWSI